MNGRLWGPALAVAFGVGVPISGAAQVVERSFDIEVGGGALLHENASALVPVSPALTLQGRYFVNRNLGLGFFFDFTRTETDDDIFPLAQFRFPTADSTLYVALVQPVAIFHYQLMGTVGTPWGDRLYPSLQAGVGGYTIYLDPQQNNGPIRISEFAFSFGGMLKIAIGEFAGLEFAVRDVVYTNYDRDRLNPTPDRTCRLRTERQFSGNVCPNERFPFLDPERSNPDWSPPKSTVHNLMISAAFSFVPGR